MNTNASGFLNLKWKRLSRVSAIYFAMLIGALSLAGEGGAAENKSGLPSLISGASINPGVYVTGGDWGSLEITNTTPDSPMKFLIDALGSNGHICNLEGRIVDGQGIAEDEGVIPENKCVIQFKTAHDRISVMVDSQYEDACRGYCGARAWFAGDYFQPIPYCEKSQSIREEFARVYGDGQYEKAQVLLTNLLSQCERFMYWHTVAEVRNDLAITEFHLGNKTACLKVLEPLSYIVEDEPYFTPIDKEWGEEMVKMVRFNWKKCGGIVAKFSHADKH